METVKIFEAEFWKKHSLHSKHHEQVQAGILLFSDLLEKEKQRTKKLILRKDPMRKKQMLI